MYQYSHTLFLSSRIAMIYYSDIINKKVFSEKNKLIGQIKDFIFYPSETPQVTKIVVKKNNKTTIFIPTKFVKKINQDVYLHKEFEKSQIKKNELSIKKNLLDRQIIDIKGTKVVRVNDVLIQDKKNFYIAGVDTGLLGFLRWFNLEEFSQNLLKLFGETITSQVLPWKDIQPLELAKGKVILKKEEEKIEKIHPADLADYLEQTNIINVQKFLDELDNEFAGEIVDNLNINYQTALFKTISPKKAATILKHTDPDESVDILLTLSKRKRQIIMNYLDKETQKEINYLLGLSKTPIGELITTEYIYVTPETRVKEVITIIKKYIDDVSFLDYIYVLNEKKQLKGVFNLHQLLIHPSKTKVMKFMLQPVIVIHLTTPKNLAVKKMLKYKINALPVIDNQRKLLGIVTFDDATEDLIEKI